jgi:hypothetical protein
MWRPIHRALFFAVDAIAKRCTLTLRMTKRTTLL